MPPKVSVVMPSYRGEEFIAEAIDSILGQTLEDFELIIVHQPSGDRTLDVIDGYGDDRIVVLTLETPSFPGASNKGLDHARGEYWCKMDDDDVALPQRLEVSAGYLDEHPEVDLVCAPFMYIDKEGRRLLDEPVGIYDSRLSPFDHLYTVGNFIPNDSAMYRPTEVRYDETIPSAVDLKFFLQFLHERPNVHQFPEPLVYIRRKAVHTSSRHRIEERLGHRMRIRREIRDEFGLSRRMYQRALSRDHLWAALETYHVDRGAFLKYMLLAFYHDPFNRQLYGRVANKMRQVLGLPAEEYHDFNVRE